MSTTMTAEAQIKAMWEHLATLSGKVGYLQGRLDAHLAKDHDYPHEILRSPRPGGQVHGAACASGTSK